MPSADARDVSASFRIQGLLVVWSSQRPGRLKQRCFDPVLLVVTRPTQECDRPYCEQP